MLDTLAFYLPNCGSGRITHIRPKFRLAPGHLRCRRVGFRQPNSLVAQYTIFGPAKATVSVEFGSRLALPICYIAASKFRDGRGSHCSGGGHEAKYPVSHAGDRDVQRWIGAT